MSDNDTPVELPPCPFCGGVGDIESQPSYSQAANTYERHRGWRNQCGFGLEWHNHESDAIAAWSTRHLNTTVSDEVVKALEEGRRSLAFAVIANSDGIFTQENVGQHTVVGLMDTALQTIKGNGQ